MNLTEESPVLTRAVGEGGMAEAMVQPTVWSRYQQKGFWPRWRMRLTLLAMVALLSASYWWRRNDLEVWCFPLGVAFTVAGLAIRVWAAGWLRKHESLMTCGPYSLVRHPLYCGTLLIFIGHGFMSCLAAGIVIAIVAWMLLYWPAVREEEQFLIGKYGDDYRAYQAAVPALIPRLGTMRRTVRDQLPVFSWRQVMQNREYEGALANSIMILLYGFLNMLPPLNS